jgi:hypothetical protein
VSETIDERLKAVFNGAKDDPKPSEADEFVFHFRDCQEDLERIVKVLHGPERFSDAEVKEAVDGMLLHAVGHLVQAARMYHGFMDPFGNAGEQKSG